MQIAYLELSPPEDESDAVRKLVLHSGQNANPTALLKARTALSYMWDNDFLTIQTIPGWVVYSPDSKKYPNIPTMTSVEYESFIASLIPTMAAVMPVKFMEPSWNQFGVIALREGPQVRAAFINGFLASSRSWIQNHPSETKQLQAKFAA